MTDIYLILIVSWKTIKEMHLLDLQKHVIGILLESKVILYEKCVHMRTTVIVTYFDIRYFSKVSIPK